MSWQSAAGAPPCGQPLLKRVRDFATVLGDGVIDQEVALLSLKRMDVDAAGLDELDRSLLRAVIEMYGGGPVGLETLAAALGEEAVTLEDLCEPYLMQMGFLTRTPEAAASPAWPTSIWACRCRRALPRRITGSRACFKRPLCRTDHECYKALLR